jgi:hypothetical protein
VLATLGKELSLLVLYGSNMGTCEGFAFDLAQRVGG